MSWTLTTSGAAILKAGLNANSSIITSGASLAIWSDEVESTIAGLTKYDWVFNYSNIKTNFKFILDDTASGMIAKKIINYDMSGYTSRTEAQTMLDVLTDDINKNITELKDNATQTAMLIIP
jgi:hypothetical protein